MGHKDDKVSWGEAAWIELESRAYLALPSLHFLFSKYKWHSISGHKEYNINITLTHWTFIERIADEKKTSEDSYWLQEHSSVIYGSWFWIEEQCQKHKASLPQLRQGQYDFLYLPKFSKLVIRLMLPQLQGLKIVK